MKPITTLHSAIKTAVLPTLASAALHVSTPAAPQTIWARAKLADGTTGQPLFYDDFFFGHQESGDSSGPLPRGKYILSVDMTVISNAGYGNELALDGSLAIGFGSSVSTVTGPGQGAVSLLLYHYNLYGGGYDRQEYIANESGVPETSISYSRPSSPGYLCNPADFALASGSAELLGTVGATVGWNLSAFVWTNGGGCGNQPISSVGVSAVVEVTTDTTYTITVNRSAPSQGQTQHMPVLPTNQFSGGVHFGGGSSGVWFDPPLAHGYRFDSTGFGQFAKILNFPSGVDSDDQFSVWVAGQELGTFHIGDSVDFVALTGAPVPSFEVKDIAPLVDSEDPIAFPIQLEFDQPTADFDMIPLYTSAEATPRNAGPNPNSLTCTRPVLGQTWQANVDLTTTGHPFAVLNGYLSPAEITLPSDQVKLGRSRNIFHLTPVTVPGGGVRPGLMRLMRAAGPNATFNLNLPLDPALVGTHLTFQAMHLGGGQPFALSNAQDLVLGF